MDGNHFIFRKSNNVLINVSLRIRIADLTLT